MITGATHTLCFLTVTIQQCQWRPHKFFQRWAKSTFGLSFSVCWRRNANGSTQKNVQRYGTSYMQWFPCYKILHWENICFGENGYLRLSQGPSLWEDGGDMSPQLLDRGGHNIFCPPQHFVIKSNVVVQISWLHCCWKRLPSIKPGHKWGKWTVSLDYL